MYYDNDNKNVLMIEEQIMMRRSCGGGDYN